MWHNFVIHCFPNNTKTCQSLNKILTSIIIIYRFAGDNRTECLDSNEMNPNMKELFDLNKMLVEKYDESRKAKALRAPKILLYDERSELISKSIK